MSESSNGMPELSSGDSEPSMEDILASIRKIIADDKSEQTSMDTESAELLSPAPADIDDSPSFSEMVEEQQFEIPEVDGTVQAFDDAIEELDIIEDVVELEAETEPFEDEEILDLINFAENEVVELDEDDTLAEIVPAIQEDESSFDESLDLVMDADASDYYAQSAESDENRLLREEIENDLNIETETFEAPISPALDVEAASTIDEVFAAPELDDLHDTGLDDDLNTSSFDDESEASDSSLDPDDLAEILEIVEDDAADDLSLETAPDEEFIVSAAQSDEVSVSEDDGDMDLVKSLLADLMDEPEVSEFDDGTLEEIDEDIFDSSADEAPEGANILDEILYKSMGDEDAIIESEDDLSSPEESELAQIARNAREAATAPYQSSGEVRAEDKVELPERNLDKKLNLSSRGGFVGVAAGAVLGNVNRDDDSDDLDTQVSQMVEEELEIAEIEELIELIEETETNSDDVEAEKMDAEQAALEELVEELELPQENEQMGRAAKKETLVDENIEQESSEAFAALSHVVQEKADMEENGPAIGDLVQDALRPMLKEWLDKNLKGIVERAVTKEVKRISSGK